MVSDSPISQVHEGMSVRDADGADVGTVREVRMGDPQAATPAGQEPRQGFFGAVAEALVGSDLPEQAREHLARTGYVRVDAHGPFSGSRYVAGDEIAAVDGETVGLSVPEERLLR